MGGGGGGGYLKNSKLFSSPGFLIAKGLYLEYQINVLFRLSGNVGCFHVLSSLIYIDYHRFIHHKLWKEGRKCFYLTTHSTHLVTVIWRRTYGKGPFR